MKCRIAKIVYKLKIGIVLLIDLIILVLAFLLPFVISICNDFPIWLKVFVFFGTIGFQIIAIGQCMDSIKLLVFLCAVFFVYVTLTLCIAISGYAPLWYVICTVVLYLIQFVFIIILSARASDPIV